MTLIFNRHEQKTFRKKLRNESTLAEIILWQQLKKRQLNGYKFRRQFSVGPYVLDFYCPKLSLAIEVDGGTHFSDQTQEYDKTRQAEIEAYGIRFLRFTNNDVLQNINEVIAEISQNTTPPCRDYSQSHPPLNKGRME